MRETARRALVATIVVVGVVALALALWKLRVLVALILLAFVIAAAMRPGVDALARHRIPRGAGVAIHYAALGLMVVAFLGYVAPRAVDQIGEAVGTVPTTRKELGKQARESTGIKHEVLAAIQKRLKKLPSANAIFHRTVTVTKTAFEILVGIFFTLAAAAYWIFERDRAEKLVLSLLPRKRRRVVRDTWRLIDLKLGAYVRGQLLLIMFVGVVLSICFRLIDLPFWLLLGVFAGVVEIIPVIGPLAAGALAIGVGLTDSWQTAAAAGLIVLVVRLFEDYIVVPRVLGHAVGLSPLVVLISVTALGLLLGGIYVLLAIPLAAVLATLVDVIVLDKEPGDEDVPTVLFPAKDLEV